MSPLVPDEVVVLLAPEHTREGLALDVAEILCHGKRADAVIEVVSFLSSCFDDVVEQLDEGQGDDEDDADSSLRSGMDELCECHRC